MTLFRTPASSFALGALMAAALSGTTATAGDYADGAAITTAASHCAGFGPGFVDMGNGTCARTNSHVRVEFGTRGTGYDGWPTAGTSSATLRSEGTEFMPGVGGSHQLRVRSGLQSLNPYR